MNQRSGDLERTKRKMERPTMKSLSNRKMFEGKKIYDWTGSPIRNGRKVEIDVKRGISTLDQRVEVSVKIRISVLR